MKTLYFDCNMGAAGDMLTAALLELFPNPEEVLARLNAAGIPDAVIAAEPRNPGTHINVHIHKHGEHSQDHGHSHEHSHKHCHNRASDINAKIAALAVSEKVKADALAVYALIAEAESFAHGKPADQIHFHEVGEADAVADIAACCILINELAPDIIAASPVNLGGGEVKCAHGILPVPAPATARILRGVPVYGSEERFGELCTPTGAAVLKHFAQSFGPMPLMTADKIGVGAGTKTFEDRANVVRVFFGSSNESGNAADIVAEIRWAVDDMTPEETAFAAEILFENNALDVYTAPVFMKKGRLGVEFTCLCRPEDREKILPLIFKHTSTLGVRETVTRRRILDRETKQIGGMRVKTAFGFGVTKSKPEYEDAAKSAREKGISLREAGLL